MSITALITHPQGLSLINMSKQPAPLVTDVSPLPLPSRFPKSSQCVTAVSPAGQIFLYAGDGSHIWEYDSRGRRASEMSFPGESVSHVLALGGEVIVALEGGLKVMEKEGLKWKEINSLEVCCCILLSVASMDVENVSDGTQGPKGRVTALVGSTDGKMVATGSDRGEVVVYDQEKGTRIVLALEGRVHGVRSSPIPIEVS